jgi:NAD(P)-dependent dehydrogenase (short-subunit alcohol dehydrogenase family)
LRNRIRRPGPQSAGLVTGGTKGVGEAVVAALRDVGATVLTTARSQPENLAHADRFVTADVSTAEGCAIVANAVRDRLGGIDIVVHVVGGSSVPAAGFAVLDDNEWYKAIDQNLLAAVRLDRALLPSMIEQGSGVIIHITSIQRQLPLREAQDAPISTTSFDLPDRAANSGAQAEGLVDPKDRTNNT